MEFSNPQVILFVDDCERAARFYSAFGFEETFRLPRSDPFKIEMLKAGFGLGLALPGPAGESLALDAGATDYTPPHDFLDGSLRLAIVEDPDGHPVQLVEGIRAAVPG